MNKCEVCGGETKNKRVCSLKCVSVLRWKDHFDSISQDIVDFQKEHDSGTSIKALCKKYKISRSKINKLTQKGLFIKRKNKFKHTDEYKTSMSCKRKDWLNNNPDKHPWKRSSKFLSKPCEDFKKRLKEEHILFVEEYTPIKGRAFSLDISIPDKKIGIEVNGNQHYDRSGKLKDYYQKRHDLLVSEGWNIVELHYASVYKKDIVDSLIDSLRKDFFIFNQEEYDKKMEFLFQTYIKTKQDKELRERALLEKKQNRKMGKIEDLSCEHHQKTNKTLPKQILCSSCGVPCDKRAKNKLCEPCFSKSQRKVPRPSKEDLTKMIDGVSFEKVGRDLGVTGASIKKWCKSYGIYTPRIKMVDPKDKVCQSCGATCSWESGAKLCKLCYLRLVSKGEKPTKEELFEKIKSMSYRSLARHYGVPRGTITRWLSSYGIYSKRSKGRLIDGIPL